MIEEKTEEDKIENVHFNDALGERYLAYALSTIMSRSLPDVRDGLKPVHRRLLYAMQQLKLDPKSGFKKCARVVGDVIGKFHPHGDQAVYDTLVRLAQSFSVRYPLIDGQGNFGSIDGDNAAAMRYTESRLTNLAIELLKNIDENTVEFKPTYDSQEVEPCILPASFPNLLANGAEGIAVGMATSIPPHNLEELCNALLILLEDKNISIERIMEEIQGPDFPTGGIIIDSKESITEIYKTGRGGFRVRGKWHKEELSHGLYQIIITEIPYQVQKSRLIEKIADLFREKKLSLLGNIYDESSEDIRIVLEPKNRSCDPEMLMESLFKLTELETRFSLNLNVITKKSIPEVLNIKQALECFLEHRDMVVLNRTNFRLDKISHRLEVLDGLMIAYLNIDEIINLIRNEDEPKPIMMLRFNLTDIQAESILNLKLRSLRKLEEIEIKREHNQLSKEKKQLELIRDSNDKRKEVIALEISEIKNKYGKNTFLGARRTNFATVCSTKLNIPIESLVEKEPITIICSKLGWIRAVKNHNNDPNSFKYKDGDQERFILKAFTTDKLILFTEAGKFFTLSCNDIICGKGQGESIKLMIEISDTDELINIFVHEPLGKLIIASDIGKGFIIDEVDVIAQTRNGKRILQCSHGSKALICKKIEGNHIAVIGTNRKLLIFNINEIPVMKKGHGVTLQKYKEAKLSDLKIFNIEDGLSWPQGERTRTESNLVQWLGHRAAVGKFPPMGFPRNNKFAAEVKI